MKEKTRITITEPKLPKYVYKNSNGNFYVTVTSKKYHKNFYVGAFSTIDKAVIERDKFIIDNYSDKTEGILPRGISLSNGTYLAYIDPTPQVRFMLGRFKSITDAIDFRNSVIDSWK